MTLNITIEEAVWKQKAKSKLFVWSFGFYCITFFGKFSTTKITLSGTFDWNTIKINIEKNLEFFIDAYLRSFYPAKLTRMKKNFKRDSNKKSDFDPFRSFHNTLHHCSTLSSRYMYFMSFSMQNLLFFKIKKLKEI